MRKLLLCLALALPLTPATAGMRGDDTAGFDRSALLPSYQVHRNYLYQGDGIWTPRVFSRDDGYFQGRGAGVTMVNGRPVYQYDRDYPYDFPGGWGASEEGLGFVGNELLAGEEEECRVVRVPDGRSGRAEVRICS